MLSQEPSGRWVRLDAQTPLLGRNARKLLEEEQLRASVEIMGCCCGIHEAVPAHNRKVRQVEECIKHESFVPSAHQPRHRSVVLTEGLIVGWRLVAYIAA
jgi:hypothetical protein